MSPYSKFWLAWGVAGVLVESLAFALRRQRSRPGELDTLSKNLQWLLVERSTAMRRVTLACWVAFSVWFADHIWR